MVLFSRYQTKIVNHAQKEGELLYFFKSNQSCDNINETTLQIARAGMNKKLIDVLEQLIAIPTVSDMSNLELIDFIENFIDGLGGEIHRVYNEQKDKANLVCYFGPDEEGGLILSGHTDTVPAEKDKWIHSPFKLSSGKDDRGRNVYFGRGVADMKTFLAQVLVVVKNFDLSRLKKPLVLVFTYDEEVGCIGIRTALEYMKNLDRKRPAHALIGEPTNFEVLVAHKGHSQMKVRIKGVKGHSSRVDEGVNAIAWGGRVMSLINNLQEKHRKNIRHEDTFTGYPFNTINIGTINGGKSINIIPDECSIEIGSLKLSPVSNVEQYTSFPITSSR